MSSSLFPDEHWRKGHNIWSSPDPYPGYARSLVKKAICGNGRASKKDVTRVMVSKFPELKVYLTQGRAWKELYHQNMFDAVALGMMALKY